MEYSDFAHLATKTLAISGNAKNWASWWLQNKWLHALSSAFHSGDDHAWEMGPSTTNAAEGLNRFIIIKFEKL